MNGGQLLPGFTKGDDRNLPKVDLYMIIDFCQDLRHPAIILQVSNVLSG